MKSALRFILGATVTAGVAVALLIPKAATPEKDPDRDRSWKDYQEAAARSRATWRLRMRAEARAIANALPAVAAESPFVRIDRAIPAASAAELREVFEGELRDAGAAPPRHPIALVATIDTAQRSAIYYRAIALPERPGEPCTVVLTISEKHKERISLNGAQRLLGACAFYAAFGAPGAANAEWLRATRFSSARYLRRPFAFTGDTAKVDLSFGRGYYSAGSIEVFGCRAGRAEACADLFSPDPAREPLIHEDYSYSEPLLATYEPGTEIYSSGTSDGGIYNLQAGLLAGLADDIGRERFGELWRGPRPLTESFPEESGQPLSAWVADYVASRTLPYHAGPGIRLLPAILGLALALVVAAVALRFAPRRLT